MLTLTDRNGSYVADIDGDSNMDLLFSFNVLDAGISCTDTQLEIRAENGLGLPLLGTDAIDISACQTSGCHP